LCVPESASSCVACLKSICAGSLSLLSSPIERCSQAFWAVPGVVLLSHSASQNLAALTWLKPISLTKRGVCARFGATSGAILRKQKNSLVGLIATERASRSANIRGMRQMFSDRSYRCDRSSVPSFLLGAGCAAMLVLSFAGAALSLSNGGFESRNQGLHELRLNRVPRLTLDGMA
jgi:hypothetical protein